MTSDLLPMQRFDPPHNGELVDHIGQLRVEAWTEESGVSEKIKETGRWLDAKDEAAFQYVLKTTSSKLVAAARLNILDTADKADYFSHFSFRRPITGRVGVISRLVILRAYHHRGLWHDLDDIRIKDAKLMNIDAMLLICGTYRLEKLKSEGFEPAGEPFEEQELPNHQAFPLCHYLDH